MLLLKIVFSLLYQSLLGCVTLDCPVGGVLLQQKVMRQGMFVHAANVTKPLQSSLLDQLFHRGLMVTLTTYRTVAETRRDTWRI